MYAVKCSNQDWAVGPHWPVTLSHDIRPDRYDFPARRAAGRATTAARPGRQSPSISGRIAAAVGSAPPGRAGHEQSPAAAAIGQPHRSSSMSSSTQQRRSMCAARGDQTQHLRINESSARPAAMSYGRKQHRAGRSPLVPRVEFYSNNDKFYRATSLQSAVYAMTMLYPSLLSCLLLLLLAHQHKAAGMKIKLSKNNDHDGYHTASNVARKATAFPL